MTSLQNRISRKTITFLAYYQIIGGILGLLVLAYYVFTTDSIHWLFGSIMAFGAILFLLSIISGQQLLKGNLQTGLNLSIITQLIQLASFAISGYAFMFISGVMISVGIELTYGFELTSGFSLSELDFNINKEKELVLLRINLVALCLLVVLGKLKSEIKRVPGET